MSGVLVAVAFLAGFVLGWHNGRERCARLAWRNWFKEGAR